MITFYHQFMFINSHSFPNSDGRSAMENGIEYALEKDLYNLFSRNSIIHLLFIISILKQLNMFFLLVYFLYLFRN